MTVPERAQFGVAGLDEMLQGGLMRGSMALLQGAPGTGKTTLSVHHFWLDPDDGESVVIRQDDFFSLGTNDLTQMTYGYSRDDAGVFIKDYLKRGILRKDPFQSIDKRGIGTLVKMAVGKGELVNPDIVMGVCGEHGGDPESIYFFHHVGLDYVSCSPYRVPVARLAAAHAVLRARIRGTA